MSNIAIVWEGGKFKEKENMQIGDNQKKKIWETRVI